MTGARRRTRTKEGRSRGDGLRTCISCRRAAPPKELLRIVAGPDGLAHVDIRGKAPGRGCYLCSSRSCFADAVKRRKVGRALRAEGLRVQEERLLSEARAGIRVRFTHRLALSQKAGRAVSGAEMVKKAVLGGRAALLLLSEGASTQTAERARGWALATGTEVFSLPLGVEELGDLIGKAPRAVVAVLPGELAKSIALELSLWRGLAES